MRRFVALLVGVTALAGSARADLITAETKGTEVLLAATADFKAPKAKVWKALTSLEGISALLDFKADPGVKPSALDDVGKGVTGAQDKDPGALVVTMVKREEELRLAFDSLASTYLCGHRIRLKAAPGGGTTLDFTERYTDSGNVDQNAGYSVDDLKQQLARFRAVVEK